MTDVHPSHQIVDFLKSCLEYDALLSKDDPSLRREVQFKEFILRTHTPELDEFEVWICKMCSWYSEEFGNLPGYVVNAYSPCEHLMLLALLYADRSGYDPSWLKYSGYPGYPD